MLVRPEWYDPGWEPPKRRWREPPGKLLTALFWACIIFCLLTQLLLF